MSSERFPVQWHEKLAVVTLPDEADLSNAVAIQDGLMSALSQRPAALVVDMSPTTFCDSAGVRAVMLAYRQAVATGCELRLVIGSAGVMRIFLLLQSWSHCQHAATVVFAIYRGGRHGFLPGNATTLSAASVIWSFLSGISSSGGSSSGR